jgi:hypothetical protein
MLPSHRPDQHAGQLFYRETAHAGGGTAMKMRLFGRKGALESMMEIETFHEMSQRHSD